MKNMIFVVLLLIFSAGLNGCINTFDENPIDPITEDIDTYEECVAAGYPILESYPEQCVTDSGQVFIRELDKDNIDHVTDEEIDQDDDQIDSKSSGIAYICTEDNKENLMCTKEYDPVCGNDGNTYSNGCIACLNKNIHHYYSGECPKQSDTYICSDEEKEAMVCTMQYAPVCGDDGKTYGNACMACSSGDINTYISGECPIEEEVHLCTEEDYPELGCTFTYEPVCGDDGKTYGNACTACSSGNINSYVQGECPELIGGQRDEHNCLGPAGYTYDEDIGACTRSWELDESQKMAGKVAVEDLGKEGYTITEVIVMRCPGCFIVNLAKDDIKESVQLNNWTVVDME